MNEKNIGRIIFNIRTKNNISQEQLSRGLCSDATLSRIEIGERLPDKFLLDALLQRLGKSPDKIETILCESDFHLLLKREEIENDLLNKNYEGANLKLEEYQKQKEAKERIHCQYIYRIKAILAKEKDNNREGSICHIQQAILFTIPDFDINQILEYYLSLDELNIILMQALYESKKNVRKQILNQLLKYLDEKYTDEEEKVKIYPLIVYLMAKQLILENNYEEIVTLCEKAIHLLTSNGSTSYLVELMQLCLVAYKHIKEESTYQHIKKQLDFFVSTYKEYQIPFIEGRVSSTHENINGSLYLVDEVIKFSRIASGMSQENLSEGICTPESLSRVENGKRMPSSQNFQSLMKKLGREREIYSTILSVDEFEILEKNREISKCLSKRQYENARIIFEDVKKILNEEKKKNKQFIMVMDTLLKYESKTIKAEEAIANYEKALSCTLSTMENKAISFIPLTKEETHIFNLIAIANYREGNKEEAVRILKTIIDNCRINKTNIKYNYITNIPIIFNLSKYLEEMDCLEEAIEYCDYGIKILLLNNKGYHLANFLMNKAYTYERIDDKDNTSNYLEKCKYIYKKAFYISDLMKNEEIRSIIKKHYETNYDGKLL